MVAVALSLDEQNMRRLGRALRSVEDGKQLRADLTRAARDVLNPTRNAARQAIRAVPSSGHAGPKISRGIANKVMVQIRLGGQYPGATLRAKKTPNVRKFRNAPKRFNARKGFTHPAINNRKIKIHQKGGPGWFDDTTRRDHAKYRRAMRRVLDAHDKRIRDRL
ncbi:hypothetical protein [Saccharothrix lopnurensis]|uniref:Bacteriophage HK97-gp10 tail-component n=1 Tax=Saccharothrix lopnurensis TaxID=1670621 RepID=A0ABW1PGT8_9PSEU